MVSDRTPLSCFVVAMACTAAWAAGAAAQTAQPAPPARAAGPRDAAAIERALTEAARRSPDSFQAQHALGEFYIHAGRLVSAIAHLERAREIDPSHYANGYDLARAYLETERLEDARQQVLRMLAAKETGELRNLLGDVEERAGNLAGAAEAYQRAAHLDPTEEHIFDWGNNLLQMRAPEPAADVFAAGVRRHPKSARLHVGLGIAQYSRGQYEGAVQAFCRAADLAPSDPRPYEFLGEMYGVSPDMHGEVTRRLARFVKLQPKNALGQYYYAMALWKNPEGGAAEADLTRVEALLRRAVALDTRLTKAFVQLGILLSEQRRWPEAIRALQAAVALEPALAQAHFRLAQAYRRSGQPELADRALATFERLKAREPAAPVP